MFYSQLQIYSCISEYYKVVRRENNLDLLAIKNLMKTKKEMEKITDVNVCEL
jgi:hypothetical protein